ncbi:MAG: bifunctional 3-(3-hydroxy-phenyl)propionate/3-hydroxycinnamic acid hydroxylase, partial [Actinomycetales bacterium]
VDHRLRVMGSYERAGISETNGYPRANMYDQPDLERVLRTRMAALPLITLRGGVEVTTVEPTSPGSATVHLRDVATQVDERLEARFVLGCDGANSTVRTSMGAAMKDLGFEQRWLVLDVETSVDLRQWDGVQQVCDSRRAATFMRIGATRYRWELRLLEGESPDDLATIEQVLPLLSPWTAGVPVEELRLVRVTPYTFRAALADRWRSGPVFLLGDAAHLTPPFIGQGLGAGVRDAANLTWKLSGVLTGSLASDVLDSYETERSAHARALVELALRVGLAMTSGGRVGDVARKAVIPALGLVPGIRHQVSDSTTPPLVPSQLVAGRGLLRRGDRLAGDLVPNLPLPSTDRPGARLDDHLGGRWALVTLVPLAPSDRERLQSLDVCVVEAEPSGLRSWLDQGGVGAAVVRPDGAVMASFGSPSEAVSAVLSTLRPATSPHPVTRSAPRDEVLA